MPRVSTTCSAPGKVLLAGGYLVLDEANQGLVLSLSARIYVTVHALSDEKSASETAVKELVISSPQFAEALWIYDYDAEARTLQVSSKSSGDNTFVREALSAVLAYFRARPSKLKTAFTSLDVEINADNEYYSQVVANPARFQTFETTLATTPKTGLGSSAALMTALVGALFLTLSSQTTTNAALSGQTRWVIHNLAQMAHCAAQGKVGSGFDVASACFGSCVYTRFPASLLNTTSTDPESQTDDAQIATLADKQWPMTLQQVRLRPGLRLMMGDVAQGSSTPGMVKKILACDAATALWPSLAIANELLREQLAGEKPFDKSEEAQIREVCKSVRGLMKAMGTAAEVDVEPDTQTTLLDALLQLPGVVCDGVPGAGGFDAVFAVVQDDETVMDSVTALWKKHDVRRLSVEDDDRAGLVVEEEEPDVPES